MQNLHEGSLDDGRAPPHPFLYTLLIVPFGASSGFVTVALAFLATKHGLSVEQGAGLVAAQLFPHVWKFFWAPIADTTLTRKRWYLISVLSVATTMAAMAVVPLGPSTLGVMTALVLVNSFGATFVGFSVEGLIAHLTPPDHRGRVSGYFQAGNLGGSGLGGGLGLWLLNSVPEPWMAGVLIAAALIACGAPLIFLPDVDKEKSTGGVVVAVRHVGIDMWQVLKSPNGILCAVLCFVPVGTGAAQAVLAQSKVAALWGAGEKEVALVQGLLTGVISMIGCLVGGALCSRWLNGRVAYAVFGALMASSTALTALLPRSVEVFVGFNLLYAFITGLCYSAFSAFVLDAIGAGHAATKYNGFASLSNAPIWYTGLVLAAAETRFGANGMLFAESILGVVGIGVFLMAVLLVRRLPWPSSPTPPPAVQGPV
jgi:PAT family beta-lactamase induction signal transducer AmpG